jgi:hypothetical protein
VAQRRPSPVRSGLVDFLQARPPAEFRLTFCVKRDLYVCAEDGFRPFGGRRSRVVMGLERGAGPGPRAPVKQDARPRLGYTEMRVFTCQEQRMLRALHGRWPYRRSHCRDDLHWLVRVRPGRRWCSTGRAHSTAGLPVCRRRPHGG